jgi:apolipoprotein N-acyltransferase
MVVTRVLRVVVAALAGWALALAFPPQGLWWLAFPAVAALTVVTWRRSAPAGLGLGFVFGLTFFAVLVRWLSVVGDDAWLLLSAYCAAWIALVGMGTALVTRLRLWPVWVACLWVAEEALRDRVPLGGFPWGRLAYSQTATPLLPLVSLAGAPLVTFAAALVSALLAAALLALLPRLAGTPRWGERPVARPAAAAVSLAAAAAVTLVGLAVPLATAGETAGGPARTTAAVVQGNVPELGLDFNSQRRAVLDNHVRETERLAADVAAGRVAKPALVIWPENSSDIDPLTQPDAAEAINRAVEAVGVPILVGAVVVNPDDPTTLLNLGIVWSPGSGPGERYAKRHPVPFGEYVPFRSLLAPLVGRFDRIPRDFHPGAAAGVLTVGPARIGDVICFEVAYDQEVRDAVTAGGRAIVVQTNNATYGRTGQPEQQLAMSRLRAVEHGRTVLVAATSGISAVILPDGTVIAELPEFTAGSLVQDVPLRDSLTLSDRLGEWPEGLLAAIGALAVAYAAIRRGIRSEPPRQQEGSSR